MNEYKHRDLYVASFLSTVHIFYNRSMNDYTIWYSTLYIGIYGDQTTGRYGSNSFLEGENFSLFLAEGNVKNM